MEVDTMKPVEGPKEEPKEEPKVTPEAPKEEPKEQDIDKVMKSYNELTKKLGSQGNELGSLRKENEGLKKQLESLQKPAEPTVDHNKEISEIRKQLRSLDPVDDDFAPKQADLLERLADIKAEMKASKQVEKVASEFKQILEDKDIQDMQEKFLSEHQDFTDPAVQEQIQAVLQSDKTGMMDAVSAYHLIKQNMAEQQVQELSRKVQEYERLLNLKQGEEETGKVIVKGQSTTQQTTQETLSGEALRQKMMEAFQT